MALATVIVAATVVVVTASVSPSGNTRLGLNAACGLGPVGVCVAVTMLRGDVRGWEDGGVLGCWGVRTRAVTMVVWWAVASADEIVVVRWCVRLCYVTWLVELRDVVRSQLRDVIVTVSPESPSRWSLLQSLLNSPISLLQSLRPRLHTPSLHKPGTHHPTSSQLFTTLTTPPLCTPLRRVKAIARCIDVQR